MVVGWWAEGLGERSHRNTGSARLDNGSFTSHSSQRGCSSDSGSCEERESSKGRKRDSFVFPLVRSHAFHKPLIDKEDGFPNHSRKRYPDW